MCSNECTVGWRCHKCMEVRGQRKLKVDRRFCVGDSSSIEVTVD